MMSLFFFIKRNWGVFIKSPIHTMTLSTDTDIDTACQSKSLKTSNPGIMWNTKRFKNRRCVVVSVTEYYFVLNG